MNSSNSEPSSDPRSDVREFAGQVKRYLNRSRFREAFVWCVLVASLAMVLIGLSFVIQGYSVPWQIYAGVFGSAVVITMAAWYFRRVGLSEGAQLADQHFELKDTVRSCLAFQEEGREGEFYDLQAKQARSKIATQDPASIPFQFPYRLAGMSALLLAIAVALGFRGPSKEVVELQRQRQVTAELTAAANEEIQELFEELEKSLTDDEKKLVDPNELKKWVDSLKETKDQKEAMRQYARLERKINKTAEALQQRREEQLLQNVAKELKKEVAFEKLAELLKQKKYKEAAEKLDKLKPEKFGKEDMEKLSERRKEIAKLKAMAKRMADAARNTKRAKNGKQSDKNNEGEMGDGDEDAVDGEAEEFEGAEISDELAELLERLEAELEEFDQALEDLEVMDPNDIDWEELEACEDGFGQDFDEFGERMRRLALKRGLRAKLKKLGKKCAGSQALGLAKLKGKGGKLAGKGSEESFRDQQDERKDNGQYAKLKGIKGNGPSLSKIEAAQDGTGVSNRKHQAKKREFKKQFESFVNREDIPDDLKSGVKNYFTNIHGDTEEE